MNTAQRQAFEAFAAKFCGVPYADLVRGETTGLTFAWECWQEAQRQQPKWTDRRASGLCALRELLDDCNALNKSSDAAGLMIRIYSNSEALTDAYLDPAEPSFLEFLNTLCRADRRNQQEK